MIRIQKGYAKDFWWIAFGLSAIFDGFFVLLTLGFFTTFTQMTVAVHASKSRAKKHSYHSLNLKEASNEQN